MEGQQAWWQTSQFDYIRIPKELFRNPYYADLTAEGRLLYGFLLDRASLSQTQGAQWRTPEGEPFAIFTLEEIQQRLNCGKEKAIKLLRSLDKAGLIRRSRPQRDGPYHITVKPFRMEVGKAYLPRSENPTSPGSEIRPAQVRKSDLNNTDINNTDRNNTDTIRPLVELEIKKNIAYDILSLEYPRDKLDAIVEVMTDTLCSPQPAIRISGMARPKEEVCRRLREADDMRIRYLFDHMKQQNHPISSYRAYYLARLWEPPGIVDAFYTDWVRRTS